MDIQAEVMPYADKNEDIGPIEMAKKYSINYMLTIVLC